MPEPKTVSDRRAGVAVVLAFVAGFVDVNGWLALDRLYTSHMTGNTASIGIALARGHIGEAFTRAVPVITFVAGAFAGTALSEILIRRGARSVVAPGLAVAAASRGSVLAGD